MFDTMNLGFTKKGILCYITKIELRFAFKRGVLLDLKISDFGWKSGVFLVQNSRKGVFSKLGYEHVIRFGWGKPRISPDYNVKLWGQGASPIRDMHGWYWVQTPIKSNIRSLLCTFSRWRHQMETSSALLAICAGNSPVPGEFPPQKPVTRSFDIHFDLRPNKRLSKQSRCWWFETPSWSLWCHCHVPCQHTVGCMLVYQYHTIPAQEM